MPLLNNIRHEAVAAARAAGLTARAAHAKAGYKGRSESSAQEVARRPDVKARIAELRPKQVTGTDADLGPVIDELGRLAVVAERLNNPAALAVARSLLDVAGKYKLHMGRRALADGPDFDDLPPDLTQEEWVAKHASSA